ncbi:sushi, nidogen and EGF-like domain-containing protein 1 [Mizuhopecten yessoensis]|uniref:sushi, nidogen and EGF-like domain-containing protein 1 n=1 Tax=Mizuhopecten yessoensis TaxID=6573 RepID=UPI000B458C70|nr:sushi, nidogen and EGF-like domain-containing protein 1 [Mizuhopecten yessoensis]
MDVDTRQTGQVWYNLSSYSEHLNRAQADVSTFFPHESSFQPTKIFIATWVDVPCWNATRDDLTKRNTFQIVLVTDGATSFAMFHYQKIEWAGYADYVTKAVVGFNAGDGVNSYTVNSSDYNDVINLVNRSNTGIAGKFIYRVDGDAIIEPASDEISIA